MQRSLQDFSLAIKWRYNHVLKGVLPRVAGRVSAGWACDDNANGCLSVLQRRRQAARAAAVVRLTTFPTAAPGPARKVNPMSVEREVPIESLETLLAAFARAFADTGHLNLQLFMIASHRMADAVLVTSMHSKGLRMTVGPVILFPDSLFVTFLLMSGPEDSTSWSRFETLANRAGAWLLATGRMKLGDAEMFATPIRLWCHAIYDALHSVRSREVDGVTYWLWNPFAASLETLHWLEQSSQPKELPATTSLRQKKATTPGDATATIEADFLAHHEPKPGRINFEPIDSAKLIAKTSKASVSGFFKRHFDGRTKYKVTCQREAPKLGQVLRELREGKSVRGLGRNRDAADYLTASDGNGDAWERDE